MNSLYRIIFRSALSLGLIAIVLACGGGGSGSGSTNTGASTASITPSLDKYVGSWNFECKIDNKRNPDLTVSPSSSSMVQNTVGAVGSNGKSSLSVQTLYFATTNCSGTVLGTVTLPAVSITHDGTKSASVTDSSPTVALTNALTLGQSVTADKLFLSQVADGTLSFVGSIFSTSNGNLVVNVNNNIVSQSTPMLSTAFQQKSTRFVSGNYWYVDDRASTLDANGYPNALLRYNIGVKQ